MSTPRKPHFLFAVYMAGGNAAIYQNLKDAIGNREDIHSSWLPIELNPKDWISKVPPLSIYRTLKFSTVTWSRIREIEKQGPPIDAAYFFYHVIVTFLYGFKKRVPYILGLDSTPLYIAKTGMWYAYDEFDPTSLTSRIKQSIVRSVYRGADHVLPISTSIKDSLIHDYGVSGERITVMPPLIDLEKWAMPDRTPRTTPMQPLKVLFVGADFLRKGGDLLLSVARREEFRDVEFHFATKSFTGSAGGNVFVHDDLKINSEALINLYRDTDIFALPTRADEHSIASLEAMAMGLPVISTLVGGIVDIVLEGETGYLISPDDGESLVDRLRTLIHNPQLRFQMGTLGRRRIEERFNLKTGAEEIVRLLKCAAMTKKNGLPQ